MLQKKTTLVRRGLNESIESTSEADDQDDSDFCMYTT